MLESFSTRISAAGLAVLLAATASASTRVSSGNATLHGTRWLLQTLDGEPFAQAHRGEPAQLVLHADSQHLSGFAGCNRIAGRFLQRGTQLALSATASTRLACPADLMTQESRLLRKLGAVDAYRIEGSTLSLLEGEVVRIAFKAAPS